MVGARDPWARRLRSFPSESTWNPDEVNARRLDLLCADPATASDGDGALVIGEHGDRERGAETAHPSAPGSERARTARRCGWRGAPSIRSAARGGVSTRCGALGGCGATGDSCAARTRSAGTARAVRRGRRPPRGSREADRRSRGGSRHRWGGGDGGIGHSAPRPQALRAARAWLVPCVVPRRYWRAWSDLTPTALVRRLLERLWRGRGIYLYGSYSPESTKYR